VAAALHEAEQQGSGNIRNMIARFLLVCTAYQNRGGYTYQVTTKCTKYKIQKMVQCQFPECPFPEQLFPKTALTTFP
jgi:hypothetical protein